MAEPYRTFAYLRLSKEDGDKVESDSISNQRRLISSYLENRPEFRLVDVFIDDGYSGTSFRRPGMQSMLKRLENGEANCVIVKDMSRFGREYIQSGLYIQRIFPELGVRFIAINDGYDSIDKKQSDDLLIPIKNLMNDSYCRELSNKLRKQFQLQRSNGEFIGAFAAYGYAKSPEDKHKLVVDDYAAEVVKGIFHAKMQGKPMQRIAEELNRQHILSPAAYKQSLGLHYRSGFSTGTESRWDANTIRRILQNRVYIGNLEQGKRYKPNYKSNVMLTRPPEEWAVTENSHEPIIDRYTFEAVQRDLLSDTRCCEETNLAAPLSGLVYCADCGMSMVQKRVKRGNKFFYYYICSGYKKKSCLATHCISLPLLEESVLHSINAYVGSVLAIRDFMEKTDSERLMEARLSRVDVLISRKEAEIEQDKELRFQLFELKTDGILNQDEFVEMKAAISARLEKRQADLTALQYQRRELLVQGCTGQEWLRKFSARCCFDKLSRETAITFLQQVKVHQDKQIEVVFACQDEYLSWKSLMDEMQKEVG